MEIRKLLWLIMFLEFEANGANNCNRVLTADSVQQPQDVLLGTNICICLISKKQTQNIKVTLQFAGDTRAETGDFIEFWDIGVESIQRYHRSLMHGAETYTEVFPNSVFIVSYLDNVMLSPAITFQLTNDTPTSPEAGLRCSGVIGNADGQIETPGYPDRPIGTFSCLWTIKPITGMNIRLIAAQGEKTHFLSEFDQIHLRELSVDGLLIPKGISHTNNQVDTFSNQVFIYIHNNLRSYTVGVRLIYELAIPETPDAITDRSCSGTYSAGSGFIRSPNYPNYYQSNESCLWYLQPQGSDSVTLEFITLNLNMQTRDDIIQVWKISSKYEMLDYEMLKNNLKVIHDGKVMIKFNSHETMHNTGFKIKYTFGKTTTNNSETLPSNSFTHSVGTASFSYITDLEGDVELSSQQLFSESVPLSSLWVLYRDVENQTTLLKKVFEMRSTSEAVFEIWHQLETNPTKLGNAEYVTNNGEMKVTGTVAIYLWISHQGQAGPVRISYYTEAATTDAPLENEPESTTVIHGDLGEKGTAEDKQPDSSNLENPTQADLSTEGNTNYTATSKGQSNSELSLFTMFAAGAMALWTIGQCSCR